MQEHCVFVSGLSAGQAPRGCSEEDSWSSEELQGKLMGRGVTFFFLYNQSWKKYAKLFSIKPSKVLFSELPIAGNDIF